MQCTSAEDYLWSNFSPHKRYLLANSSFERKSNDVHRASHGTPDGTREMQREAFRTRQSVSNTHGMERPTLLGYLWKGRPGDTDRVL